MRGWLRRLSGGTVIVHIRGVDPSLKGILTGVHSDCIVLRDPIVIEEHSDAVLDGDTAIILRESIEYMQVI